MPKHLYRFRGQRETLILQWDEGWGEIAPLPGFSRESLEEALQETLAFLTQGKSPSLPSVKWGLLQAQKPLDTSPLKIPLCALHAPHEGSSVLKLKVGHLTVSQAIEKVRPFLGLYRLRIDSNRKWSCKEALEFTRHFSPTDFDYLEEPTFELAKFASRTLFPIALDETVQENLHLPQIKAAVIKPTIVGHLPKLPLPTILSSSYESSLGILQIARLGDLALAHGLDTFVDDVLDPPLQRDGGNLTWAGSQFPIRREKLCWIATAP